MVMFLNFAQTLLIPPLFIFYFYFFTNYKTALEVQTDHYIKLFWVLFCFFALETYLGSVAKLNERRKSAAPGAAKSDLDGVCAV